MADKSRDLSSPPPSKRPHSSCTLSTQEQRHQSCTTCEGQQLPTPCIYAKEQPLHSRIQPQLQVSPLPRQLSRDNTSIPQFDGTTYEVPPPTRKLHVNTIRGGRNVAPNHPFSVVDLDNQTLLYQIRIDHKAKNKRKKPSVMICDPSDVTIATLDFRWTKTIIMLRGEMIQFGRAFISKALPGQRFKWVRDGRYRFTSKHKVCIDENKQPFARIDYPMKNGGVNLELASGVEGALMDELVVTGIAYLESEGRANNAPVIIASAGY